MSLCQHRKHVYGCFISKDKNNINRGYLKAPKPGTFSRINDYGTWNPWSKWWPLYSWRLKGQIRTNVCLKTQTKLENSK